MADVDLKPKLPMFLSRRARWEYEMISALIDIAESSGDFEDYPNQHANWCIERAHKALQEIQHHRPEE